MGINTLYGSNDIADSNLIRSSRPETRRPESRVDCVYFKGGCRMYSRCPLADRLGFCGLPYKKVIVEAAENANVFK